MTIKANEIMSKKKTLIIIALHGLKDFYHLQNFVKEVGNKVIFLRKLQQGGSNHSFGIHVARMAGMPVKVVERAKEILVHLEKTHRQEDTRKQAGIAESKVEAAAAQLSFFQLDDPVLGQIREEILNIDINNLTPVEALMKLSEIKKLLLGRR